MYSDKYRLVALVVIPQSIAYSTKLANLPAEYGLYTSFMGVLVYAFFATSKDTTIGPTAVLSLVVGQTISNYLPNATGLEAATFAATVSFWTGLVEFILGLVQWGVVVDFVPVPVIAGFTSGAGIQIMCGQLPVLTGVKGINTSNPPFLVLLDFIRNIGNASLVDVLFGITSLSVILFLKFGTRRIPLLKRIGFLRNTFVIVLFTGISVGFHGLIGDRLSIVKTVPYGLTKIVQPDFSGKYEGNAVRAVSGVVIVSLLEHIAVSKSYGRLNGYTPNANQEMVAMGLANLLGAFVGAYPVTGSFSRSAIQSSSGSKTPFAAFITGATVVVSLFTLTPALYYIPNAVLAAIIIAAISELLSGFKVVKSLFEVEILDFIGFWIALLFTIFSNIEVAIYASVGFSLLVLLARIARPHVKILNRLSTGSWIDSAESTEYRSVYPNVTVKPAPPGIICLRMEESLTYPNGAFLQERFKTIVLEMFEYTGVHMEREERVWNDDREEVAERQRLLNTEALPSLRAVVFDLSAVNHIDYTGLQTLLDIKEDLERYSGKTVPFHFAYIRRRFLRTLWRVNGGGRAADVDATPGAALTRSDDTDSQNSRTSATNTLLGTLQSFAGRVSETRERLLRSDSDLEVVDNASYFHFSIDSAVAAALEETEDA
ncbi:UNVERIFIED_CONTAM: hypothetical protein HDU68_000913 [Siphonaria sp. JEL0065]|nr:hypothetical protein HDU68_000913 [Siphonaria sp. JEL0065]